MNTPRYFSGLLLLVAMCFAIIPCKADDPTPTSLSYRLKASTLLQECNDQGVALAAPSIIIPVGAKFSIAKKQPDGSFIISFWEWSPKDSQGKDNLRLKGLRLTNDYNLLNADGTPQPADKDLQEKNLNLTQTQNYFRFNYNAFTGTKRLFLITAEQLAMSADALVSYLNPTAGALVMPFKYRPRMGDFTKDITFSGLGGFSFHPYRRSDHAVSLLLGVGIASVTLTPDNSTVTESADHAAISLSLAFMYQWERLQLGILTGRDYLGQTSETWKDNKKVWLAAGIGFNIFSPESTEVKGGSQ
ncbi:hypothetical protein LRS06_09050 [Hymenobacter sp. J193]|uniref:hypothetical protein n=1 Tax=Hymenobacter sp. J193 TaxID=2898429 RepID=UPI002151ECA4|nr:hypothetical protein [Hymenobacter sp. J193]MCR5887923.1 hypothetical protein [Hymenobacter sp. J193]